MRIGIIGSGFTGVAAALQCARAGHKVYIFEKQKTAGGLAGGFIQPHWEWHLDHHYHHIFTTDTAIQKFAISLQVPFRFSAPELSWFINQHIYQIDSPIKLLTFSQLPIIDRLRMGATLGYYKLITNWKSLEHNTAAEVLPKLMGEKAYELFWRALLVSKFGSYAEQVSLAWFWARIKSRSMQLGYPDGGFQALINTAVQEIKSLGGTCHFNTPVKNIHVTNTRVQITHDTSTSEFDRVLVTAPYRTFLHMTSQLPSAYHDLLTRPKSLGAITTVLVMRRQFFSQPTYWLSICDKTYPFVAVVEHTHFVSPQKYGGQHIVYIAKYLEESHPYFNMTDLQIMQQYMPYLEKLRPNIAEDIISVHMFRAPFAQPIVTPHFSQTIPTIQTPLKHVYLATMQQVYPWDRQTNYAVEMGMDAAEQMMRT